MNTSDSSTKGITRRSWLALVGASLSACGGGADLLAGLPGTGGTGSPVFAMGPISGFGSVIINGTRFDDALAQVRIDGQDASSADLRLGMVAEVQGERGAVAMQGTASRIDVWVIAQGTLTAASASGFQLAGMAIRTSASTVFSGVGAARELVDGQPVAVWGLQATADGTGWSATRVELLPAGADTVSSGVIRMSNGQRMLNGLLLTGSAAEGLATGLLVRVRGELSVGGRGMRVASASTLSSIANGPGQGDAEIEGYITALGAAGRFTLGSIEVDASSATFEPRGAVPAVGDRVEIEGTWVAGVLVARKVGLEDEEDRGSNEITGTISEFTSIANFVVRGQRCDARSAVISGGNAADLKAGIRVKVTGTTLGDVLVVSTLEFED